MGIRVAVAGATGKLGRAITQIVRDEPDLELVGALDSHGVRDALLGAADAPSEVVVDATAPAVSGGIVDFALANGRNVLVGTSGWSADRLAALSARLERDPERGVVVIPNFSVGAALATAFAAAAGRFYDSIEIVEAHGAAKIDSPSGTAVRTAELIAQARASRGPVEAPHVDQRARGQQVAGIPVHSLRMTGIVARQETVFGGRGETLTIRHDTSDSGAYRHGILLGIRAAAAARGLTVGLESLIDLGLAAS